MKKQLLLSFFIFISLNVHAQNPQLWGTLQIGGSIGLGSIIKINGDGSGFEEVYPFTTGSSIGNLLPNSSNQLYGLLVSGGTHFLGEIYKYDPVLNQHTLLYSFDSSGGYYPRASLYQASDGKLYGTTTAGGSGDVGSLFSFDPTNNNYLKLHDFDGITGQYPLGNVIQSGNKLYGMTNTGGTAGFGVIFSWDINTNTFAIAYNLAFNTGGLPFGSFIDGGNGKLYAPAFGGGTLGYGVIFSFDPTNNSLTDLYNFDGTNGSAPTGILTQASDGLMYGMTSQGGANNFGVIYSFNPSNNTETKLLDFDGTNGSKPNGSLIQASDDKLYGMTLFGGTNDLGLIFSFDPSNNTYTKLLDCSFTIGALPNADLVEFYAVTGIDDIDQDNQVSVFPNPFTNSFTVKINNENSKEVSFKIENIFGQIVFEKNTTPVRRGSIAIDMNNFEKGIYIIDLLMDGKHVVRKMVKQ